MQGGSALIPGQGTKIPHATEWGQNQGIDLSLIIRIYKYPD